jgi:hypothetical protein
MLVVVVVVLLESVELVRVLLLAVMVVKVR